MLQASASRPHLYVCSFKDYLEDKTRRANERTNERSWQLLFEEPSEQLGDQALYVPSLRTYVYYSELKLSQDSWSSQSVWVKEEEEGKEYRIQQHDGGAHGN